MFKIKGQKAHIINNLFQSILITYLLLILVEEIWPKAVTLYLNLNYLLIITVILGILDVFSETKKIKEKFTRKDHIFIIILSIIGFVLIKYKTQDLGYLSYIISIIAGALIYLVSTLIYEEDEKDQEFKWNLSIKKTIILSFASLTLLLAILSFTSFTIFESFRIVFGSVYVLFLPGFLISHLIFWKNIDFLERMALSFGLSIAVVPLLVFYLNLIGLKISTLSVFLTVLTICTISGYLIYSKHKKGYYLKKNVW